ncbi:hypothetical protein VTK26DRAFT_7763 [Humicola hyalothermophila]
MACNMMAPPMPRNRNGHIIALEGPSELVTTQLRLLPSSSQILILPGLQHYLGDKDTESRAAPFDVRELILAYHTAAQTRHAEALDFLRSSSASSQKRLVFMNGGTISAQAACLEAIMELDPEGDIEVADATYCRLVSNGLAGLRASTRQSHIEKRISLPESPATAQKEFESKSPALNRSPENRQSIRYSGLGDEDDTMGNRIMRAMRAADALDKETEFLQPENDNLDFTVKLIDIPSRSSKRLSSQKAEATGSCCASTGPDSSGASPISALKATSAESSSPDTSSKPNLKIRIPSPPIPWAGDVVNRRFSANFSPTYPACDGSLPKRPRTAEAELSPRQKPMEYWGIQIDEPLGAANDSSSSSVQRVGRSVATELAESKQPEDGEEAEGRPFEEVLPLIEDLVLLFSNETPDQLQDFIFRRLSTTDPVPSAGDGGGQGSGARKDSGGDHNSTNGHATDKRASQWTEKHLVHGLPTPGHSPSPLDMAAVDMRLYNLSVDQETAVSIQNFLRSLLATQFPLQDHGFRKSLSGGSSGEGGLWKPLECDGDYVAPDGGRRLDLILAVGAESRVQKSKLAEVVGQLEKLGFKASGISRSGRLDLRYLIANAMQAFTAQPLTKQTQTNPFVDRTLLAALILPHLETYIATHPDVRFLLIEYPSEHLPTVLALQTLIGTEMMKVVGIVNGEASSLTRRPSALTDPDAEPLPNRRPSEGFRSMNKQSPQMPGAAVFGSCSFSKANFLLASQATGLETAAFVAAIRESLISISDFYIPDRPLYEQPVASHLSSWSQHQHQPRHQRPAYPQVNVNFKPPPPSSSISSAASPNPSSRVSTSTLMTTPPSSPTDSFPTALRHPPQTHFSSTSPAPQRKTTSTHARHHNRSSSATSPTTAFIPTGEADNTIPPRTSSTASPSSPSSSPFPVPAPSPPRPAGTSSIRWAPINYGPPPSSTPTTQTQTVPASSPAHVVAAAASVPVPVPPPVPVPVPMPVTPDSMHGPPPPSSGSGSSRSSKDMPMPPTNPSIQAGPTGPTELSALWFGSSERVGALLNFTRTPLVEHADDDEEEEEEEEDEDERRLMPMRYLRRPQGGGVGSRGGAEASGGGGVRSSRGMKYGAAGNRDGAKALRWLGLE